MAQTFKTSIVVDGNVNATGFYGDGSNLTGITPTGALLLTGGDMTGSLTITAGGIPLTLTSSQNTGLVVDGGTNSGIIADFKFDTRKAYITTSGNIYASGLFDIDDTNYYVNPTGTSRLSTLNANSIIATASEGREILTYLPSSYTTDDLVSGHEYGWYDDHWRLGMTRSNATPGADFVVQWNGSRRLSLTNGGNLTVTGTLSASGYNKSNWDTAYGWGNHANAGYLTSYTETDTLASVTGRGSSTTTIINGVDIRSQGQIRATGWYNSNSGTHTGLGTEIGVSGGQGYILSYNRTSSSYGVLNLEATYTAVANSLRAPIFYDSNNTGYYLDPASTSRINTIYFDTLRNPSGNWILGQQGTNYFSFGSSAVADTVDFDVTYITQASRVTLTDASYYRGAPSYGFRFNNNADTINSLIVDNSGNSIAYSSHRAPIFYDSNNTGYYVDPASTSNLNALNANSWNGYGIGSIWRTVSSANATVGAGWMTVAYYGSGRGSGEVIVTDGESSDHSFIRIHWMRSYADSNFTVLNCGGHANRITGARVIYDTADNTYGAKYLQVYVTVNSNYYVRITQEGDTPHFGSLTAITPVIENSKAGYATHGSELNDLDTYGFAAEEGILAGGPIKSGSSLIAPIFYDSNNAAYYVDPTGGSVLAGVSFRTDGTASNTPSVVSANIGVYADTYAFIDLATSNTNGSWIDFSKADGGDYGGRIRYNNGSNYMQFYANGAEQVRIFNTNAEALGSFRAPIFYDSNDTGYYLNPQGFSNLGRIKFNDVVSSGAPVGDAVVGRNYAYNTLELKGYGAEMMIGAQSTAININYRYCNNTGNSTYTPQDWYWRNGTSSGWSNHYWGLGEAASSLRAPIFYDSNDTNYYVDANSSSQIVKLGLNTTSWDSSNLVLDANGAVSLRQGMYMGVSTNNFNSWSGRIYVSGSTQLWSGQSWGFNGSGWGGGTYWSLDNSGNSIAAGSHRAPIFYDSNNTGYYVDPASTSNVNNLYTGGESYYYNWIRKLGGGSSGLYWQEGTGQYWHIYPSSQADMRFRTGAGNGGIVGTIADETARGYIHWTTSNEIGFLNASRSWSLRVDNSGNTFATSSSRAPIFYDNNNTNYYVNPAGTSNLSQIVSDSYSSGQTLYRPSGAEYTTSASPQTGAIKITLPHSWTDTMLRMTVKIYEYSTNESFEVNLGGYTYGGSSSWINTFAYTLGNPGTDRNFTIRFGHDGSKCCVYIGETNSTWSYLQVVVTDVKIGYSYYDVWNWDSGWSIGFATSFGAITSSQGQTQIGRYTGIMYSYDNTGYYIDPDGTLRQDHMDVNTGNVARLGINNSSSTSRYGLSLYGGYRTGEPTYGILFTGTSLGSHGSISGDWATYFTMNDDASRGWIFRRVGSGNCASISAGGHAAFNGDVTAYYSDMRLKTKIADIENPIEKVKSLSGFIYEPNEIAESYGYEKERKVGVSAQEVQAVLPEAVKDAPIGDGYLTVQYDKLVPLLIEAIKEQQKQIEELKAIVNGLTK